MDNNGRTLSSVLNRNLNPRVPVSTSSTPTVSRSHVRVTKRASRACQNCRLRKVRCDLDVTGVACGNCKEDELDCVAMESRRSRKSRREKRQSLLTCNSTPSQVAPPSNIEPWLPASCPQVSSSEVSTSKVFPAAPNAQTVSVPTERPSCIGTAPSSTLTTGLPPGINGPRHNLNPKDHQILQTSGALTVPDPSLRDELILSFILYVHPYMPVLDLQRDLLDPVYLQENESGQCSLLLFQAVMFAGSAFVDLRLLETVGFRSRRAARKAFYSKVKASANSLMFLICGSHVQFLYDLDWETNRITIIQSLLLLNYWYLCPEDQKDPWHWMGVCLSLGTSIGLNDYGHHLKLPTPARRLWRRLWWMCVLRDRVLATTTRKPLRIREDDINIPFLTLDDFETEPIISRIGALLGSTLLCSSDARITLARLCIEKVKLSLYAARIMTQTYTVVGHKTITTDTVMLSWPRRDSHALSEAVKIHHDLEKWRSSLPEDCVFSADLSANVADARVLHVHRATLHMFWLITAGVLYYPYVRTRTSIPSLNHFLHNNVQTHVQKIGSVASGMAELMLKQDLVRYLPPLAVTFFLPPLVRLIGEIKSSRHGFRDRLESEFRQCNRAILRLRETWPIADSACLIIEGLFSRTQMPEASSATSAVFLDQDQPQDQNSTMDAIDQSVIPDDPVSNIETEITLPRQDTISGSGGMVGEGISFPTNVFEEIVWSDIEPWFDHNYSPTGDLLWVDLALMDYGDSNFARPTH